MTDYKLDLKNKKILYALDIDSRQSFHTIARTVGLSTDAVIYRVKQLRQAGIIKRFHTIIDNGKLGLISFRLYLKLRDVTPERHQQIIAWLTAQRGVNWLASIDGPYDIALWLGVSDVTAANVFWKELFLNYRDAIERHSLTIFTHITYFPRAYLIGKEQNLDEYVFVSEPVEPQVDETDVTILRLLAPDARIPVITIAQALKLSVQTIIARIRSLEERRVIVGYRTMFDLGKLGYEYFKIHLNLHRLDTERVRALRLYLKGHPNVVFDNEVLGGDDIEFEVQVESVAALRALMGDVRSRYADIIRDSWHMLFYEEHKFLFFPEDYSLKGKRGLAE